MKTAKRIAPRQELELGRGGRRQKGLMDQKIDKEIKEGGNQQLCFIDSD